MSDTKIDIVATWPKTKPLQYYLDGLARALANGEEINFRVANRPHWGFGVLRDRHARCYMVHDGAIRGYNEILYVIWRERGEVKHQEGGFWPPGWYLVRSPIWYSLSAPIPMKGFQGWRWLEQAGWR